MSVGLTMAGAVSNVLTHMMHISVAVTAVTDSSMKLTNAKVNILLSDIILRTTTTNFPSES